MSRAAIRTLILFLSAAGLAASAGPSSAASSAGDAPDVKQMAARGRATLERLKRDTATWKTVFETQGPGMAFEVTTTLAPTMRETVVEFVKDGNASLMDRIIERDNAWYVTEEDRLTKYRPFEAPLMLPLVYSYMARADLRAVVDESQLGKFESLRGNVATYRSEIPESAKRQLQQTLKTLEAGKAQGAPPNPRVEQLIPQLRDVLERGVSTEIDIESGILLSAGGLGNRFSVKDFHWLPGDEHERFAVDEALYVDETANLLDTAASPHDLLLIGHAGAWQPGTPPFETDVVFMNIKTGDLRRVPYPNGVTSTACFAKDRRSVFVAGQVPDDGAVGLFQIDLSTGKIRRLAESLSGVSLFPAVSPNGKTLAFTNKSGGEPGLLDSQVVLVDIASGKARPLGAPLDTASVSWLPEGDGLVLVSRKYPEKGRPSVDTISRMDLDGRVTPIRAGSTPSVLAPYRRIVFLDQADKRWNVCDLNGKGVAVIGDGLPSLHFPTVSPDGRRLIMMAVDPTTGPRPYVVDIATGSQTAIPVRNGLWVFPAWR